MKVNADLHVFAGLSGLRQESGNTAREDSRPSPPFFVSTGGRRASAAVLDTDLSLLSALMGDGDIDPGHRAQWDDLFAADQGDASRRAAGRFLELKAPDRLRRAGLDRHDNSMKNCRSIPFLVLSPAQITAASRTAAEARRHPVETKNKR